MRANPNLGPGDTAELQMTLADGHGTHVRRVQCEVAANAVWRRGRVFFRCDRCAERCTRLYVPLPDSPIACRRCWGLSYPSRQRNYKGAGLFGTGAGLFGGFGLTHRGIAILMTAGEQERRKVAALARYGERRPFLTGRVSTVGSL